MSDKILYYVHDPMCSWCYGFTATLDRFLARLPQDILIREIVGGLAPDSDAPMSEDMRSYLRQTWKRIQAKIPDVQFNFDFWSKCQPRRSTYPACRAVIAAGLQDSGKRKIMTNAIQYAYYQKARNPSDQDTLIALAHEIGLDKARFASDLTSSRVEDLLQEEIVFARSIRVESYPSLVFVDGGARWNIPIDYSNEDNMLDQINMIIDFE